MKKNKFLALIMVAVLATSVITGCGNNDSQVPEISVESGMVSTFHEAIKGAYGEQYLPNMSIDDATLTDIYGIEKDLVANYVGEVPMIGTYVDSLIIIEATEGNVDAVETALNTYKDTLLGDSMQYPMNLAKINSSVVYSVDEYVFFIMLGAIDETNEDEDAQLEFAKAEIQIAIDAIDSIVSPK